MASINIFNNAITVDDSGRVVYNNTLWEDLRVPMTATKAAGVKDPDFAQFRDNGSGSTGVFAYKFDPASEEELFFTAQMPHSWKEGTAIYPHIHWAPTDAGAGNVVWGLEYTVQSISTAIPTTTLISVTQATGTTAYKHNIASFSTIDMTGHTISAQLICRVYRDAANGSDTYASDAALLEIDFHYERDTPGSAVELAK